MLRKSNGGGTSLRAYEMFLDELRVGGIPYLWGMHSDAS